MSKYKVSGTWKLNWEMEIEAETALEAENIAKEYITIETITDPRDNPIVKNIIEIKETKTLRELEEMEEEKE